MLARLAELRDAPPGTGPDPAFRARLRERLLAEPVGREPEPRRSPVRPVPRTSWLTQLATVGLAAAMMLAAFVTYRSVPGEPLYPLKRAAEDTLVRLSPDPVERGERELVSAKTRAQELDALLRSPDGGPHVGATLKDMDRSTRSGISRLPRSTKIKKFAEDQRNLVEGMLPQLDGPEQVQASGYLDYIDGLVAPR
ncbi:DUF5667 domain-containing protein [Thermoactinospora rubra]|uniref:DUF5667 domain-containing protein n=1 Tax=Thermoactinospora rubra TaxID=1088767 RepID=UPI000A11B4D2|nr:DUF5667 domain-containing protein [Thermoactinospora rubra]